MKMFDAGKTRMIGLPYGEKNYDDYVKPFSSDTGTLRTDGQICYINIARQHTALLTGDKKYSCKLRTRNLAIANRSRSASYYKRRVRNSTHVRASLGLIPYKVMPCEKNH